MQPCLQRESSVPGGRYASSERGRVSCRGLDRNRGDGRAPSPKPFLELLGDFVPRATLPPASRPLRPPFGRQKPLLPPLRSAQGGRPEAGIRVRGTTRIAPGRRWLIGFGRARGYAEPWCGRGTLARRDERPSETIPRPIVGPAVPGTALLSLCAESGSPQGRGLQARRCAASFISCCFWRSCRRA